MMKIYFEDAGGGWNALKIRPLNGLAQQTLIPSHFSLTCEKNAPFLTFEVDRRASEFRELRNPDIFSQFCKFDGLSIKNRTDDQNVTPGKRGFARLNSSDSCISLQNIAFQSWKTMTFAVRFTTMPVKATFFSTSFGNSGYYCNMTALPNGNGTVRMQIEYQGLGWGGSIVDINEWWFAINRWYYFTIVNTGSGLNFFAAHLSNQAQAGNMGANRLINLTNGRADTFYGYNATRDPAPGQALEACNVSFGTGRYKGVPRIYHDSNFNYDIAWIHFFDYALTNGDNVTRDANSDWIYTQFPKKVNTY
jgi:hypothetical protein